MVALLTGAVMFALGLFFGWLLHRERVERALYEDVVRTRDRATTTLAETAARLELANEDMVRLRGRLTAAQHLIDERQAAVAKLERELAGHVDATAVDPGARGVHAAGGAGGPSAVRDDAGVTAGTMPAEGRLFDQLSLDEEADITEEVVSASRTVGSGAANSSTAEGEAPGDLVGDDVTDEVVIAEVVIAEPTVLPPPGVDDEGSPRGEIGEPLVLEPVDAEPAPATDAIAATDAAEAAVATGVTDTTGVTDAAEAADAIAVTEAADAIAVTDAAEAAVANGVTDTSGVTEAADAIAATDAAEAAVATGVTDTAEVAAPQTTADDLRRITGVGPALDKALQDQGITTFRQLALLDDDAVDDLRSQAPRLVARLRRDNWVSQARRLHVETYGDEP